MNTTSENISANQQKNTSIVYTNLPKEWGNTDIKLSTNIGIDILGFMNVLEGVSVKKPDNISFVYIELFNNGYVEIPILFEINGVKHPFFFIYNEVEAKNFIASRDLLIEHGFGEVFYASLIDINEVKEKGNALKTGGTYSTFFTVKKDGLPKGEYALWWKSEEDSFFSKSKTKELVLEMYESFHEYETWHFGFLVHELKLSAEEQEFTRVELPEEDKKIPLLGPENIDIILSVSREKGIKFLFPTTVSKTYRERLLKLVLDYAKGLRMLMDIRKVEKDDSSKSPIDWFSFICTHLEKIEESGNEQDAISQISAIKIG